MDRIASALALAAVTLPSAVHAQTQTATHPHAPMGIVYLTENDAQREHISQISPTDERFLGRLGARVDLGRMMRDQARYARHYRDAQTIIECMASGEEAGLPFEQLVVANRVCLKKGERMDKLSLRAAWAEQKGRGQARWPDRMLEIDVDEVERFSGLVPGAKVDISMVARCAAAYSPGLAARVLSSEPGDEHSEGKALKTLYHSTPECGLRELPRGLSTTFQRAALALALDEAVGQGLLAGE